MASKLLRQKPAEAVPMSIDYEQAQAEEIESLRAIYMEDFDEVEVKSAWGKKNQDRSFKLKVRSSSDRESFVVLYVKYTATYPKTAPLLDLQGLDGFHQRTQHLLHDIIQRRPKELLGSEMIFTIVSELEEGLENAVHARQQGTLPSLEDERANAEEVAIALAKKAEEEDARRLREMQNEEERILQQMVDEELHRSRKDKRKPSKTLVESSRPSQVEESSRFLSFDQPAQIQVGNDMELFKAVTVIDELTECGEGRISLARPQINGCPNPPRVIIRRNKLQNNRADIIDLESKLNGVRKLRHPNVLSLFAYRVDKVQDRQAHVLHSELIICQEYADRGTLYEILSAWGTIGVNKTRQLAIEVLDALDYLHRNGIAHGCLSLHTIHLSSRHASSPKLSDMGYGLMVGLPMDDLPSRWRSSPISTADRSVHTTDRKADIWDFGIILVQLLLGLKIPHDYASPAILLDKLDLSDPLEDLLGKAFTSDQRKRPSAFDLMPAHFLRTESSIWQDSDATVSHHQRHSSSGPVSPLRHRSRHNSSSVHDSMSRYLGDFTELGRLGRGGFGEVVKARNKLDGGIYAVKKIRQTQQLLDRVLSEVILLNRLNHPYVVRYFSTWVENEMSSTIEEEEGISATDGTLSTDSPSAFGYQSTGGLDFVSSSGYPGFEFADDDDADGSEDDEDSDGYDIFERSNETNEPNGKRRSNPAGVTMSSDLRLSKSRSHSRRTLSTLYIQMEFCERRTLRDLIHKGMADDDCWRYVRQITEGLAHVHSHGIIHRDLKPDNVFVDVAGNPKIGDFGLATTGQYVLAERGSGSKEHGSVDMTRSVGTALYVAPELHSSSGSPYTNKVDMYSLGIIIFEMNEPFGTAMERINELQQIRKKDHVLPASFQPNGERAAQGQLIRRLISYKASERPSSTELLRSDIPSLKVEDETVQQALSTLADPRSPYHQKVMSALFTHDSVSTQHIKALAWESKASVAPEDRERVHFRSVARAAMETVFKSHGAEETRREGIFPRSELYTNPTVVQMLDASGNLLQLPYDLTLAHARQLARHTSSLRCTYAFGVAYRDAFTGGPPKAIDEADFDIVGKQHEQNLALDEAEMIKVIDEVIVKLPILESAAGISFQISHGSILDAALDHCRVPTALQFAVKETLSKLGIQGWDWARIRSELRSQGLTDTTLDDLKVFDFRDSPEKTLKRLHTIFDGASSRVKAKYSDAERHLYQVLRFHAIYSTTRKLYLMPLSCFNAKFFEAGLLFQCVLEKKTSRIVLAAGGRYDSLIRAHCRTDARMAVAGAVGVCIGLDVIVSHMVKVSSARGKGSFAKGTELKTQVAKRCDVAVLASSSPELHIVGLKTVNLLWDNSIGAELASAEMKEHDYAFIVTLKHESSTTARVANTDTMEEADVPLASLVSHLTHELRERTNDQSRRPLLRNHSSQHDSERQLGNVHVLMARHGSKKSNKYHLVEMAQQKWSNKLEDMKGSSILAVEGRDDLLELIQSTTLGNTESWRDATQSVQLNERQYMQQVQDVLMSWRKKWAAGEGTRTVGVVNFRTGTSIYYDLGL